MNDPVPDEATPAAPSSKPPKPGTRVIRKPATGTAIKRRQPSESGGTGKLAGPVKPDIAKTIAIGACAVLLLACVVVGIYVVFLRPAKAPPEVTNKLSAEADQLVSKAKQADTLYNEAKEKAKSDKLEDLTEAADKMTKALAFCTEIKEASKTVPGYEKLIDEATDKYTTIDAELRKVSVKKTDAEMAKLRDTSKKSPDSAKVETPAAPAVASSAGKEPTEKDLSDENIKRLITDDPSEAERLIKFRKQKDPTYKPPAEP